MTTRAPWSLFVAIGLLCLVGTASAQDTTSQPWLHVQISSSGHDDSDGGHDHDGDGGHDHNGDDYGHGGDEGRHDDDGHDDHGHGDSDHGDGDGHREDGDDDGDRDRDVRHDEGEDDGDDHGREEAGFDLNINLPLSAVEPLVNLVPHRVLSDGQFALAGHEVPLNISAMRDLWRAIAAVGDTEFLTVDAGDETIRVARVGDEIRVQVKECDEDGVETVDIRLPVVVVDALLSGNGETLNVGAAVERLADLRGDIVRVTGADHQVRVWIDEVAQPGK